MPGSSIAINGWNVISGLTVAGNQCSAGRVPSPSRDPCRPVAWSCRSLACPATLAFLHPPAGACASPAVLCRTGTVRCDTRPFARRTHPRRETIFCGSLMRKLTSVLRTRRRSASPQRLAVYPRRDEERMAW